MRAEMSAPLSVLMIALAADAGLDFIVTPGESRVDSRSVVSQLFSIAKETEHFLLDGSWERLKIRREHAVEADSLAGIEGLTKQVHEHIELSKWCSIGCINAG